MAKLELRPSSTVAVNQDTFGFGLAAIAIAFGIYITAKGELPTYLSFFFWSPAASTASATPASGAPQAPSSTTATSAAGVVTSLFGSGGVAGITSQGSSMLSSAMGGISSLLGGLF